MGRGQMDLWTGQSVDTSKIRWSLSRYRRFQSCLRRYYLVHYAAREGHDTFGAGSRELLVLKQLRNRFMWIGEIVHDVIHDALKKWRLGHDTPLAELYSRANGMLRAQFQESQSRIYQKKPLSTCGLWEHEYQHPVSDEDWRAHQETMERCLKSFIQDPIAKILRTLPRWRWVALENSSTYKTEHAAVFVKPDVAWRNPDKTVEIVDWKTGGPSDDGRLQLSVYAHYAVKAWGADPGQVVGHLVYLSRGETESFTIGKAELEHAASVVESSSQEMLSLEQRLPSGEAFPMTVETGTCQFCNFKRLCDR